MRDVPWPRPERTGRSRRARIAGVVGVGLGPNDAETMTIHRVGEEHLVEVDNGRRRRGQQQGRAVEIRLTDPTGQVV